MKTFKILLPTLLFILPLGVNANSPEIKYRTNFGDCPSKVAGSLAIKIAKEFDVDQSLRQVKQKFVQNNWKSKYFLSEYLINYNPIKSTLNIDLKCPKPLLKVQIYKGASNNYYDAVLVDNGELFDPTYEALLKTENKIKKELAFLAIPENELNSKNQLEIANLFKNSEESLRDKITEMILNEDKSLTIILSIWGKTTSAFLGDDNWVDKFEKLNRIISFAEKKDQVPLVVNLVNVKKVVVKFNGKI